VAQGPGGRSARAVRGRLMVGGGPRETVTDYYRVARDDQGRVTCRRVLVRSVHCIALHGAAGFECGLRGDVAGANDLAVSILADFLGASPDARDYENPRQDERSVWLLRERFRARWLLPRAIGAGEYFDVSAQEIEDWIVEEGARLPDVD
jgi:hypothetical protein